MQMIFADRKKKKKAPQGQKRKSARKRIPFLKFFKILRTFQIVYWEIALSSDDFTENARWYWVNFFPSTRKHVYINYVDENYLVLVIRNQAWRIVYAFLK